MIKKETRATAETLIQMARNAKETLQAAVANTLKEHGKAVEFDYENNSAPSIDAGCFGDDDTDCYITKIWNDKGLVKANLHAYYLGDDREDIDLSRECLGTSDWAEILEYILGEIED
jgi:hypothetical protein